jgi:hypothetical protein
VEFGFGIRQPLVLRLEHRRRGGLPHPALHGHAPGASGPFFLPIAHDLGFSRSLLATIVAVGMLTYGLAMPVAGG